MVLPSIFEEQILAERRALQQQAELSAGGFAEAQTYFPLYAGYGFGTERYLDVLRRAKQSLAIPVIASLNCVSDQGRTDYALTLQQAGADAIELNVYFVPADLTLDGRDVEGRYLEILRRVRGTIAIPMAMKLNPYFSAIGAMARSLAAAGADALVLFNRFYQPDIDVAALRLRMDLDLSRPAEMRLPLLWPAVLRGRVNASLAASTGVDSPQDVLKYLLAGADTVMTTSSLLRHGVRHMATLRDGLSSVDRRGRRTLFEG